MSSDLLVKVIIKVKYVVVYDSNCLFSSLVPSASPVWEFLVPFSYKYLVALSLLYNNFFKMFFVNAHKTFQKFLGFSHEETILKEKEKFLWKTFANLTCRFCYL